MKTTTFLTSLMALTFLSCPPSLFAEAKAQVKKSAPADKYSDFPKRDEGFIGNLWNKTNIPVKPQNVVERSERAALALKEALEGHEGKAFELLVDKSECIVWLNLYRLSAVGGVRAGAGLASCRLPGNANHWSAPFYIATAGLSGGLQMGLDQSDSFLFFPEKATLLNILGGNVRIDGSAALTVAKWGRSLAVGTDIKVLEAEIQKDVVYTYSISRGAFFGLTFEGGMFFDSEGHNEVAYDQESIAEDILVLPRKKAPKFTQLFTRLLEDLSNPARDKKSELRLLPEGINQTVQELKDVSQSLLQIKELIPSTSDPRP